MALQRVACLLLSAVSAEVVGQEKLTVLVVDESLPAGREIG